ncbi:MAG: MATE family efflux transporter [Proteobacteria bacterium]|nr:MATE family efflux transporter [Pseudomonadota bacterium]
MSKLVNMSKDEDVGDISHPLLPNHDEETGSLLPKSNTVLSVQHVEEKEEKEKLLTLKEAIKESARFAIPFALSRVVVAIQNFGNGIIISYFINSDAIAAAPVMFMLQQGITGAARGALSTVNVVAGTLNGEKKYSKIGPAVNQGLLWGTLIGIPTTVLFSTSDHWLKLFGINEDIVAQAGQYLRAISYGIIPTYWTVIDQNFVLSIKRSRSPIVLNSLFVFLSMVIGFPLAATKLGLAGLGYGVSASACITFITGRCYFYFNKFENEYDREKYQLFSASLDSGTPFSEFLGLSLPTALQAISEWLPTMLISMLTGIGESAKENLEAEEPSMQMLVMLNLILLGLGTAATVSVANALGRARDFEKVKKLENASIWKQNARIIGYSELIVTGLATLPPALFMMIYPDPLVWLFSGNAPLTLAKSMLRFTGASLLLDGLRNTTTGALLGKKKRADNFFTSSTNLLITSAGAVTAGYFLQDTLDGPLSFFLSRMLAILITALILLKRWDNGSKNFETSSNTFNFFKENQTKQITTKDLESNNSKSCCILM